MSQQELLKKVGAVPCFSDFNRKETGKNNKRVKALVEGQQS